MELKEKQLAEDSQRNEQVHKEREELMKKELEEARNSVTAMQRLVQSSEVQKINNETELRTRREIYTYTYIHILFLSLEFSSSFVGIAEPAVQASDQRRRRKCGQRIPAPAFVARIRAGTAACPISRTSSEKNGQ